SIIPRQVRMMNPTLVVVERPSQGGGLIPPPLNLREQQTKQLKPLSCCQSRCREKPAELKHILSYSRRNSRLRCRVLFGVHVSDSALSRDGLGDGPAVMLANAVNTSLSSLSQSRI